MRALFATTWIGLVSVAIPASWAQAPQAAPDTMEARLRACALCHGEQGRGTDNAYFPRLAGKPPVYLLNQLNAFHDGRRRYPPMNYLLEFQPESYLEQMAAYYADQHPPPPPPEAPAVSKAVLAQGEDVATKGVPDRHIPACAACHGTSFTGMEPAIPALLGLRATYITAQLGAWRYGTRTARAPDCMQIVASSLTQADVTAVSAWLSSLPVPSHAGPIPQAPLPMPCGSEPAQGG